MKLGPVVDRLHAERTRLTQELSQIDQALAALKGLGKSTARTVRRGRRKMSAAARKRIGAAQRARWAKWKAKQKRA